LSYGISSLHAKFFEKSIKFIHPGDPTSKERTFNLHQHGSNPLFPTEYSMWVDSVICRDSNCDIVKVRLYWDLIGNYKKFEVEKGSALTKVNHEPFTNSDLKRLHEILLDKKSALAEVDKMAMTKKSKMPKDKKVDAVSSATILSLRNDVIIGAGYTCYDLWHLANGAITELIKENTQKFSDIEIFKHMLKSKNIEENVFAINSLKNRKRINDTLFELVESTLLTGSEALVVPVMQYIITCYAKDKDENKLLALIKQCKGRQRLSFYKEIALEQHTFSKAFYQSLCLELSRVESFYESQIFFQLCKDKKVSSKFIIPQAIKLLSNKKFFIQRRAYKYLKEGKRHISIEKEVDKFYKMHKHRL